MTLTDRTGKHPNFSMFFALLALFLALAAPAGATVVNYQEASWDVAANEVTYTRKSADAMEITDQTTWGSPGQDTWCYVSGDVTIGSRVNVNGTVNLILADNAKLTASVGITVQGDTNTLVIYAQSEGEGMGRLIATGGDGGAGIGGNGSGSNGGAVTVHGGAVEATGGRAAAGIGGGGQDTGTHGKQTGEVTVYGGVVTAQGGTCGAGIGGGASNGGGGMVNGGDGGPVTIHGGVVTANGSNCAAGIGGGGYTGKGGTVNITGGVVTANGSNGGAGIGGGGIGGGIGGAVIITGGVVTATGGSGNGGAGAGIGGGLGFGAAGNGAPGTLKIGAGVTVYGGSDASSDLSTLASGPSEDVSSRKRYMLVMIPTYLKWDETEKKLAPATTPDSFQLLKNSSTEVTWNNDGWYVATGDVKIDGRVTVNGTVNLILCDGATLTVPKGITVQDNANKLNIYAQSGGTGKLYAGTDGTTDGDGKFNVTCSDNTAGIGGGKARCGGTVTVQGGNIIATGGDSAAGIGGGLSGDGGAVTVQGGNIIATGGSGGAGIGGGLSGDGGAVTVQGGNIIATGGYGGAGIGGGNGGSQTGAVTVQGGNITAIGGSGGAGIGGGDGSIGGPVNITGGTVTATGGDYGAGIGAGKDGSDPGTLTVGTGVKLYGGSTNPGVLLEPDNEGKIGGREKYMKSESFIPVRSVTLSPAEITVSVDKTVQLTATLSPANATSQDVTWSSDIPAVVSVDSGGRLTALKAGSPVIITVTATNGMTAAFYHVSATCRVTVNKGTPTLTKAPAAAKTLPYNGTAQKLVTAGETDHGTLVYRLDSTTYSTDIPVATDAGKYAVYYMISGDADYNDTAPASLDVSIAPLSGVTVTITGNKNTHVYDGSSHSVSGYDVKTSDALYTAADFTFSGTASADRTDAGTTSMGLTASQFKNANTNFDGVTFNVTDGAQTITAKSVTNPAVTVNPGSYVYNGAECRPDVTVKDGDTEISNEEYSASYSNNVNPGTATVTITDNDGGNYTVSGQGTFTIAPWGDDAISTSAPSARKDTTPDGSSRTSTQTVFTEPWEGHGIIASVDIALTTTSTDLTATVDAPFVTTVGVSVDVRINKQNYSHDRYTLSLDVTGLPNWLKAGGKLLFEDVPLKSKDFTLTLSGTPTKAAEKKAVSIAATVTVSGDRPVLVTSADKTVTVTVSEDVKPDPVKPDPVNPDPVNPDPVNPDPVNPDPVNPDPVNPDPVNPDPVNPDDSGNGNGTDPGVKSDDVPSQPTGVLMEDGTKVPVTGLMTASKEFIEAATKKIKELLGGLKDVQFFEDLKNVTFPSLEGLIATIEAINERLKDAHVELLALMPPVKVSEPGVYFMKIVITNEQKEKLMGSFNLAYNVEPCSEDVDGGAKLSSEGDGSFGVLLDENGAELSGDYDGRDLCVAVYFAHRDVTYLQYLTAETLGSSPDGPTSNKGSGGGCDGGFAGIAGLALIPLLRRRR